MVVQTTTIGADTKRVPLRAGETTPWLDLMRRLVPHVRVVAIPGVAHFPQIEVPERGNALLAAFLRAFT